jgi:hypothetical protein
VSVSVSAPMPDDRSFHVLEAVPSRLEVGASARTHMGMVRSRQSVSDGHDDNLHGQCGSKV